MISLLDILGYVIAIAVAKAIMYIIMKLKLEKKKNEIADVINDIADLVDNFTTVRNILKEVAWYIKNDKVSDKTALFEDVKRHIKTS